eukprot:3934050-Rhodomonas_salina.1
MPRPAAACSQRTGSRDLQEAKHDIEALIKVQERRAAQQGGPNAAELRQANMAAAAAASVSLATCPGNPDAPPAVLLNPELHAHVKLPTVFEHVA